jgi:hypothetical protein
MLKQIQLLPLVLMATTAQADNILSFGEWSVHGDGTGSTQIMWSSDATIAGFQFDFVGATVTSVSGGITEKLDWMMSHNDTIVLGVALTVGAYIPPQSTPTHLLTVHFSAATDVISFGGVLFVDSQTQQIEVTSDDVIIVHPACPSDLNGDAMVNVVDLLEVVGSWGEPNVPSDINGDGIVNVSDLLLVVDAWGPC